MNCKLMSSMENKVSNATYCASVFKGFSDLGREFSNNNSMIMNDVMLSNVDDEFDDDVSEYSLHEYSYQQSVPSFNNASFNVETTTEKKPKRGRGRPKKNPTEITTLIKKPGNQRTRVRRPTLRRSKDKKISLFCEEEQMKLKSDTNTTKIGIKLRDKEKTVKKI